ncbi:MAG: DMT family protein [Polyangiaceae bacterium]|nr:DMT family protein [Polyangiaceae bacterium]
MNSSIYAVLLLIASNAFMTFAWYGHLRMTEFAWFRALPIIGVILFSWGIAFFEYCCQVPANRIGYQGNGGPFSLIQLKIIQEAVSLGVFVVITVLLFRTETFRLNHILSFLLILCAVYLAFKK